MITAGMLQAAEIHVSKKGDDAGDGSAANPFLTIQRAADVAQPGDAVMVHEGIYRERVNPPRGGLSGEQRITYLAAPGEEVVIKGSEKITGWEYVADDTWSVTLTNRFFGNYNPFGERLEGAWYEAKQAYHTGAVYLNGHWLKEAASKAQVLKSLAHGDAGDGAAELMNIQSFIFGGGTQLSATNFIAKSESVEVVSDDPNKIFVGRMTDGAFVTYNMDFGEETKRMSLLAASPLSGGIIELRKGGLGGELVGRIDVGFTAEWTHFQRFHVNITPQSGVQKIVCVFKARPAPPVDPAKDVGIWFAEVDNESTTIWADFKGKDPNKEMVEINVRKAVFYPEQEGINYLTVRGFTMEHSANPWTAPTAEQPGLIGTHWSKGWIIEDNTIRYSVCVGLTLGKHGDEHDHTYDYNKTSIPNAVKRGWSREKIGGHLIRNNHIYNCGQGGIQGSLGSSFSTIIGNEIHDIRKDHKYGGCETAGIKLHGAIDVVIADNHIYNCEHWGGIWLDWMAQGARVTGNLLHGNSQDLMFEVNHGPFLVDNNLLLSRTYVTDASGGGAFAHNLWFGSVNIWPDLRARKTPYFEPHSTKIVGRIDVDQNDDRFYNNVFIGAKGTSVYDKHGFEITAEGNVFLSGAKPSIHDVRPLVPVDFDPAVKLEQVGGDWWLELKLPAFSGTRPLVNSRLLGRAAVPEAPFEDRDGNRYRIDRDYFGNKRTVGSPAAGPFRTLEVEEVRLRVWPKK